MSGFILPLPPHRKLPPLQCVGTFTETYSNNPDTNIEYNFMYLAATANAALQGQSPAVLAGMPVGPGVSPQPGFFGRGGVWLPVVIQLPTGQAKSI